MDPNSNRPEGDMAAKIVAVIDVGSNGLRMVIAEVLSDGKIDVLERLERAVHLGQDTFRRGRLGRQSMRATVAIFQDFQKLLQLYDVRRIRAVATSAVREAANADTLLDRIRMATGLQVEVIVTSEESRLTASAVRHAVGGALGVEQGDTLIVSVGGGSAILTLLHDGDILTSQSLRLGAIRLQEMLATGEESPKRSTELLRQHIANELSGVESSLATKEVESLVTIGGDARFAAEQVGQSTDVENLFTVDAGELDKLVRRCGQFGVEELSRRYGLPFADAETLNPALLVLQALLRKTKAERMIVSHASMRDGLLLDLARDVTGQEDEALLKGVVHSALAIARKFHVDLAHARKVTELAVRLFDELQTEHGLSARHRLLLRVAGLLHEVGEVVSNRAHHKHSFYLISQSEIFGLGPDEIAIVAHVARYHRRGIPKLSHLEYMALSREMRVVINKLSALLRVADALGRGHVQQASDLRFERRDDDLTVYVPGGVDLLLEQKAVANKGDLFEDIYGMKIRLEEM